MSGRAALEVIAVGDIGAATGEIGGDKGTCTTGLDGMNSVTAGARVGEPKRGFFISIAMSISEASECEETEEKSIFTSVGSSSVPNHDMFSEGAIASKQKSF